VLEPHDIPISATDDLTNRPGHNLTLGIDHQLQAATVLTDRRLGDQPPAQEPRSPL